VLLLNCNFLFAQVDTSKIDTLKTQIKDTTKKKSKPLVKPKTISDSILHITDTIISTQDSVKSNSPDSAIIKIAEPKKLLIDTSTFESLFSSKYYPVNGSRIFMIDVKRKAENNHFLFYLLIGTLLFASLIKAIFSKYFSDIFKIFFQSSFRQKQTREQLLQDSLPSLLMNILFFISSSIFITLIAKQYHLLIENFWLTLLYSTILITSVYFFKYIFLSFIGWVFNIAKTINAYVFTVFIINKLLGVILIPVILIMAFSLHNIAYVSLIIALILIAILFIYRYWLGIKSVRNSFKVSALHFFLYLCAVEVLPMVLLYKAVFNVFKSNL